MFTFRLTPGGIVFLRNNLIIIFRIEGRLKKGWSMKKNCWEFMKCGREPDGKKAKELGVCPAATETRVNGTHDGKNAGRACWAIAGTMCRGNIQCIFVKALGTCFNCKFYERVTQEEDHYLNSSQILKAINKNP